MLDPRGQLLRAAVGFAGCSMLSYDRALWAPRTWLDSWAGIGAVGMYRPRAAISSSLSTTVEITPWRAVQRAAWDAFGNA